MDYLVAVMLDEPGCDQEGFQILYRAIGHELEGQVQEIPGAVYKVDGAVLPVAPDRFRNVTMEKGVCGAFKALIAGRAIAICVHSLDSKVLHHWQSIHTASLAENPNFGWDIEVPHLPPEGGAQVVIRAFSFMRWFCYCECSVMGAFDSEFTSLVINLDYFIFREGVADVLDSIGLKRKEGSS